MRVYAQPDILFSFLLDSSIIVKGFLAFVPFPFIALQHITVLQQRVYGVVNSVCAVFVTFHYTAPDTVVMCHSDHWFDTARKC